METTAEIAPHPSRDAWTSHLRSHGRRVTKQRLAVLDAVDAVPRGGNILVRVDAETDGVLLLVEDDGPGVAAADRDRVFGLGVSTKAAEGAHGRGIGLALVARIVARRAGRVEVTGSTLGGAAFEVWLPGADQRAGAVHR